MGKFKRTCTRRVVNRAAHAFRLAAQAGDRSQATLGAFYRRMKARSRAPKAIAQSHHSHGS
ncbi:MAG: hypothetical protein KME12_24895 [Trichocoleus desertorum ATA4-8-CV12]|nr:hypothetical protein [Trichocoleus desertorum ATA4-8-CV12]